MAGAPGRGADVLPTWCCCISDQETCRGALHMPSRESQCTAPPGPRHCHESELYLHCPNPVSQRPAGSPCSPGKRKGTDPCKWHVRDAGLRWASRTQLPITTVTGDIHPQALTCPVTFLFTKHSLSTSCVPQPSVRGTEQSPAVWAFGRQGARGNDSQLGADGLLGKMLHARPKSPAMNPHWGDLKKPNQGPKFHR